MNLRRNEDTCLFLKQIILFTKVLLCISEVVLAQGGDCDRLVNLHTQWKTNSETMEARNDPALFCFITICSLMFHSIIMNL